MIERFDIAGYTRISVDDEQDRDNTSIENQKAIIEDFVKQKFPGSAVTFYEDRDRSGYTFEQREGYQKMRPLLMSRKYDILIVKDFSRFARRNSRGLVELEDLRDQGVRIISIGDSIDYPTYDDWTAIQFRFLVNEMPVTDTSKKVKSVIKRRQNDGKWICAVPYGYVITNSKSMTFDVDEPAAAVIQKIYDLYLSGWGYRKISNHLTDLHIPTPRMAEKQRKEENGDESKLHAKPQWSIVTVQGILENDFYIGTLRQGKYTRKKINGADMKKDEADHIVFENNHAPIIDYRTFASVQQQRKQRTTSCYRGIKKNENVYSGFLICGDCGSPMFSTSRDDLRDAYSCGAYHRRGLKGCTSHHTRVDVLDGLLKEYVRKIKTNSSDMLDRIDAAIKDQSTEIKNNEETVAILQHQADDAYEELKATKRQRVRDIMKHPEKEEILEQTYNEMESELEDRISGIQNQISLTANKRNTIIQVNRIARTAIEIFDEILEKEKLDKRDLDLIIEKIFIYEDHIDLKLKSDIDSLLRCGALPQEQESLNFTPDIGDISKTQVIQRSEHRLDKVYDVNVVSSGDPLEIYTEKDGEVIFKKYSPLGELSDFAVQICDSLYKTGECIAAICDRDSVIACSGAAKKECIERRVSGALTNILESRKLYYAENTSEIPFLEEGDQHCLSVAAPIISEGDVMGGVIFLTKPASPPPTEVQIKLASAVSGFLGKQMET